MQWKIDGRSLVAAALLVGGALLMPPAGIATAQAPESVVDDIVGLRVGMSYDAVVALLEGRDDALEIETAEQWIRQSHGLPTRQLLRASDGVPCAEGEKATNIGWYAVCDTVRGRFGARKEVTDEIVVAFTGMPEQEVAGSIWRRSVFLEGKYPTVASVIDALTQKYGASHIRQTSSGYYSMSHRNGATNLNWIFAANGSRVGNNDSLKSRCVNGPKPWFATEHSWNGGCGLTIRAEILPVPGNNLLVQVLNVSVVNQKELLEALGRFEAEIKAAVELRAQSDGAKPEL